MCRMPSPATRELGAWSVLTGHKQNWGPPGKEEGEWKPGSSVCEQVCPLGQVVHRPKRRGRVLLIPIPPTAADVEPRTRSAELDRFGGSPHSALREELLIRRQRSALALGEPLVRWGGIAPRAPTEATSTRTCARVQPCTAGQNGGMLCKDGERGDPRGPAGGCSVTRSGAIWPKRGEAQQCRGRRGPLPELQLPRAKPGVWFSSRWG